MATDRQNLKLAQAGQVNSFVNVVDPLTPATGSVAALHTKYYQFRLNDNGVPGTPSAEFGIPVPVAGKVTSVTFVSPVALTMDAANIKTFTLAKRTAGGVASTIAVQSTITTTGVGGAGNLLALQPYKFVTADFTLANVALAAGDTLTAKAIAAGTGVIISGAAGLADAYLVVGVEEN